MQSINVLHSLQGMQNKLAPHRFVKPPRKQSKLLIEGVEVSVRADLLIHATNQRKGDLIGAAILRMTKDDATTPHARNKRKEMGLIAANLIRRHVELHLADSRNVENKLCMSIDVQHGEVFFAPRAYRMRMRNIESACKFIAAMW